jgi:hypothetical protein
VHLYVRLKSGPAQEDAIHERAVAETMRNSPRILNQIRSIVP